MCSGFRVGPAGAAGFQEVEGADDVGVDEIVRAGNRAIDVRFGRQVQHVRNGMLAHDAEHGGLVAQIDFFEDILRLA